MKQSNGCSCGLFSRSTRRNRVERDCGKQVFPSLPCINDLKVQPHRESNCSLTIEMRWRCLRDRTFSVELGRRDGATLAPYFPFLVQETSIPIVADIPIASKLFPLSKCHHSQQPAALCCAFAHGSMSHPPSPRQSSLPPSSGAAKPTSSNVTPGNTNKHHASNHRSRTAMIILRPRYRVLPII